MNATPLQVGIADMQVLKGNAQLQCFGLGSCISICIMDPEANVAGMAHIALPKSFADIQVEKPGKFADTGVPELVEMMVQLGANPARLVAAVAGGAQVVSSDEETNAFLSIGDRTASAVVEQLQNLGIKCVGTDLGGSLGRTVTLSSDSGQVVVRKLAKGEDLLCNLKD